MASSIHRQNTLESMRRFNARRKLKGGIQAIISSRRMINAMGIKRDVGDPCLLIISI